MEYFRGLLFLTTNRVGQIDDAFMSRVHVAIGYDRLTSEVCQTIWKGFFAKLDREMKGKIMIGPSAKRYVLEDAQVQRVNLNGREIRNALQTAIALAEYESVYEGAQAAESPVIVEEDHFRRVLKMSRKFHEYVDSIRKQDEGQRANALEDRNDYSDDGEGTGS